MAKKMKPKKMKNMKPRSNKGPAKKTTNKNKQRKLSKLQKKIDTKPIKKASEKTTAKKTKITKKANPPKIPGPTLKVSPIDLKNGDTAPSFSVKDQDGNLRNLSDYTNQKLILYFYPKDLTPGCTVQACDFRDSLNKLKSDGVEILGVSMDDERLHQKFIKTHGLNFPLLSDTTGKLCYDYGALKEKNNYGKKYVGIVRKTFIVENGKILKVYPQVKAEGHVQEVINDLAAL